MKSSIFLLALIASISSVFAAPLSDDIKVIKDSGRERRFRIADDELEGTPSGERKKRQVKVSPRTAQALREHARNLERSGGSPHDLVLYEDGKPRSVATRRVLLRKVLVESGSGFDPASAASAIGATGFKAVKNTPSFFIFELSEPGDSLAAVDILRTLPGVVSAEPMLAKQQTKRLIPNDTFFSYNAGNPGYQWHLRNTGQNGGTTGIDVNILTTWDTYRGNGVRIGIVDDGMEVAHPDLSPNADTVNDHDWNDSTPNDPTGDPSSDTHGTACAGVAGARGNNGSGVTGAAYNATLVGLRLIAGNVSDADEAEALTWKNDIISIYSNSWGPADDAKDLYDAGTLVKQAFANSATSGRGGRGTIWVWAAGNGGDVSDNSNYDGYANSIYTIAIGAMNDDGIRSNYSEPGANVVVVAPSNDIVGSHQGITTTTTNGGYEHDFGGTSSACPLAAGVVALVLQANPNLGWRDVQEILMKSARKVNPGHADWINNNGGSGFHFNHEYGAGLIDAQAAVNMALGWTNLGPQTSQQLAQTGLSVSIPDNSTTGVTRTFSVPASPATRVEHVTVTVTATHARRGDLEVTLTSPAGTASKLYVPHTADTNSGMNWTFMSVRNWSETATGNWTVKVADRRAATAGTLTGVTLKIFGSAPAPAPQSPSITSSTSASGTVGQTFNYQIAATNSPTSYGATNLPAGLSINPSGLISGIPTQSGTFNTVGISATNAAGTGNATLTITVSPAPVQPPVITSSSSASGTVGLSFSYQITATNTPSSFGASNLPSGLSINGSGLISGTPLSSGTFSTVGISATNSGGTGNATITITITPASPPAPVITSSSSATGTVGTAFSYQITATNNPTSYGASNLPSGLNVNGSGLISGTPLSSGTFSTVGISATNSGGTGNATITITINPAPVQPPVITSASTANGTVGSAFNYQITGTNTPTSFGASNLPAGLSVSASGLISGTPLASGTFNTVEISATNIAGTGNATITLTISPAPMSPPVINSSTSAGSQVSVFFSYQITATNNPTSYGATNLPSGLSISPSGLISGTPALSGTFNTVGISATNSGGTGNATLTITISPAPLQPPSITSSLIANGTLNQLFSSQISATNSPTSYAATGLPSGLTINTSSGLISGTPTVAGATNVAISATNAAGSDNATLVINISAASSPLANAIDAPQLIVTTGGNAGFVSQTFTTHDGVDAARSGTITHDQLTSMETTVEGPGYVRFFYRVSCEEGYDYFDFEIDGNLEWSDTGDFPWANVGFYIPPGTHTLKWIYSKDGSISAASDRVTIDQVTFTSLQQMFSDTLDYANFTWSQTGNGYWLLQDLDTNDGVDSMLTPVISHNQSSSIETTVMGPGTLTFYWQVSSEPTHDKLRFEMDGVEQFGISGEVLWEQKTVNITSGAHVIRWRYAKDYSVSTGYDGAWLDQVSYTPNLAGGTPFTQWVAGQFLTAEHGNGLTTGPTADPDGDGRTNAAEYAFGGNPKAKDIPTAAGIPQRVSGEMHFTYTIDSSKSDLTITPQTNDSLPGTWSDATSEFVSNAGNIQTRRVRIPLGPTLTLFHLEATLAP